MHLTVGITGHRDLVPDELPGIRARVLEFLVQLEQQYPDLQLQVLSALAEGADQLVADVALDLGLPLIAVLPFEERIYRQSLASEQGLAAFDRLLARSTVITMPPVVGISIEAIAEDDWSREQQYAQLGIFLSNHCQILLALWDGKEGDPGGTASVMNYHLTAVMPGFDTGDASANLLANNENDLAFHVVCSRDRTNGEPALGLEPLETFWMTAHFGRESGAAMPAEYQGMLERLEEFNQDLLEHEQSISQEGECVMDDAPDLARPSGSDRVDELFRAADWLAGFYQKRFARGLLAVHVLAVAMGLVFIVYSESDQFGWLIYLFLALFVAGIFIHIIGDRGNWHRKYLDYRALAEGLRVQVYWNLAGVVETQSAEFAYENFLQKQDVDLAWIRHVMRSASLLRSRSIAPDERWVEWVGNDWVGHGESGQGQLGYYQRTAETKAGNFRRTSRLASLTLWAGIGMALVLALAAGYLSDSWRTLLFILMGAFPLVAAVRDAYSHKKAEKELIKQYRFMLRVFANARRLLDSSPEIAFRRRILRAVGNAALEEHAEWILMHRERPLEHGRL